MSGNKPVIHLSNITKDYKTTEVVTHVLKGISLSVYPGEFLAVTGPSGSGKSTLMNIIGLLDTPTTGTYKLSDRSVTGLSQNSLAKIRSKEIGFVFQSFNLLARASALDNIILPAIYAGMDSATRSEKAIALLTTLGLEDKANNRPNQLSGGQQQRIAIARALINDPQIILADEPTGNLDTKSGQDVMRILKNLNKGGKTIIMITHEHDIARQAKNQIHIKDGVIVN